MFFLIPNDWTEEGSRFFLYYRDIVPFHDVRLMQRCRQNLCGMMWLIYLLSISFFLYFTLFHFILYSPFLCFFLFIKHLIPCSAAFNCNGTQCTRWQSFSKRWHWLLLFFFLYSTEILFILISASFYVKGCQGLVNAKKLILYSFLLSFFLFKYPSFQDVTM